MPFWFFFPLGLSVGFSIYCRYKRYSWYPFAKPVPMLLLIGYYGFMSLTVHRPGWFEVWIGLGLVLCLAGDILLLKDKYFVFSLAAFLAGHLAYIFAFQSRTWSLPPWILPAFLVPMLLYGAGLARTLLLKNQKKYVLPVLLYILVLTGMGLFAVNYDSQTVHQFYWFAVGAFLFMISDTILAFIRFIRQFWFAQILILVTYYGSQALILHGTLAGW